MNKNLTSKDGNEAYFWIMACYASIHCLRFGIDKDFLEKKLALFIFLSDGKIVVEEISSGRALVKIPRDIRKGISFYKIVWPDFKSLSKMINDLSNFKF